MSNIIPLIICAAVLYLTPVYWIKVLSFIGIIINAICITIWIVDKFSKRRKGHKK